MTEETSWRVPSLKVRKKMFACVAIHRSAEPDSLVVRLSYVDRDWLIASRPDLYYLAPHYVDYACVLVRLRKINKKDLRELLENAIEFVSSRPRSRKTPGTH